MTMLVTALYVRAQLLTSRLREDDGLEAVEYALIAALIAVAIIAAVIALQGQISNTFNDIRDALNNPGGGTAN